MAHLVLMPSVSANSTHAIVQEWGKSEGDNVAEGDVLAEIETDKAVIDLTAEQDGIMGKALVDVGISIEVGAPIAIILAVGEGAEAGTALFPEAAALTTEEAAPVSGQGPGSEEEKPSTQQEPSTDQKVSASASPTETSGAANGAPTRLFASPIARKLARERGLDVGSLAGSGPGGRIVRQDVEAASEAPAPQDSAAATAEPIDTTVPAAQPATSNTSKAPNDQSRSSVGSTYTEIPHSGMRRTIARRLAESKASVPHFYLTTECNVDALVALRAEINKASPRKISINDFVIRAMASALSQVPEANVTWTDTAIRQYDSVDISVAVSTPTGLITPIVRGADRKSLGAISAEVAALAERARAGKLQPSEYEGGSFSISNLGMHDVTEFQAIINPPQAGILAVGTARLVPVVKDGAIAIATIMKCSLSIDHRSVDGELAARLLSTFTRIVENPLSILI
jgi:pyruvate dehydrogenase E2 component (dihydrolipoamide acetyltransferase)